MQRRHPAWYLQSQERDRETPPRHHWCVILTYIIFFVHPKLWLCPLPPKHRCTRQGLERLSQGMTNAAKGHPKAELYFYYMDQLSIVAALSSHSRHRSPR
jgi:hypothetical protein